MTHTIDLPADMSAPRLARRWLAEQLSPLELDEAVHERTILATSELVSNAVRHVHAAPTVCLQIEPGHLTVGVRDNDDRAAMIRDPYDQGGWGLRIVEGMSDQWGTTRSEGTKVVWFSLAIER